MDQAHYSRKFKTDVDYGPGWRQAQRDTINDDVAPDDVSLLGPPTRSSARSESELGAYGYAGQDYPIYGERRIPPYDDPEPGWFADPASAAYAFGYTTSMRSPSSGEPAAGRHYGKGPKDYLRVDARVLEDVCDRLSDDDEVDASDISVSISNGEVTLAGTVVDRYSKRRAENLAASVRGVLDVHNHLRAKKGLLRELGDKLVGEAADEHHGHHGSGTSASHDTPLREDIR
jgi:osmotically-inducible protein OsmY